MHNHKVRIKANMYLYNCYVKCPGDSAFMSISILLFFIIVFYVRMMERIFSERQRSLVHLISQDKCEEKIGHN